MPIIFLSIYCNYFNILLIETVTLLIIDIILIYLKTFKSTYPIMRGVSLNPIALFCIIKNNTATEQNDDPFQLCSDDFLLNYGRLNDKMHYVNTNTENVSLMKFKQYINYSIRMIYRIYIEGNLQIPQNTILKFLSNNFESYNNEKSSLDILLDQYFKNYLIKTNK